jgi:hypothetical protein
MADDGTLLEPAGEAAQPGAADASAAATPAGEVAAPDGAGAVAGGPAAASVSPAAAPADEAPATTRQFRGWYVFGLSTQVLFWTLVFLGLVTAIAVGGHLTEFRYVGF